ncbi:MAG: peptidoglycan-associated lipoprotein Pal [Deltaproteobacteria bacterium]|nr:peptidoglycan-associated lipoprotein Pal [Deltaproteobacteria bacterium]
MKNKVVVFFLAVFFSVAGFTGCAKLGLKTGADKGAAPQGGKEVAGDSVAEEPVFDKLGVSDIPADSGVLKEEKGPAAQKLSEEARKIRDVYFDYDRYSVRDDEREALEENARLLKKDRKAKVLIEGHADERGSAEYNIALGERRADAVKRYLSDLGIDSSRISTVSYGKEKPSCLEHTEECWQKNRRARFVITY